MKFLSHTKFQRGRLSARVPPDAFIISACKKTLHELAAYQKMYKEKWVARWNWHSPALVYRARAVFRALWFEKPGRNM